MLNQRLFSPTINLWFKRTDFFELIKHLNEYIKMDVTEELKSDVAYPVGRIGSIHIYFMHYDTFEEAKSKWEERKQQINWNNVYIVMVEGPDWSEEDFQRFEQLPYEHKNFIY